MSRIDAQVYMYDVMDQIKIVVRAGVVNDFDLDSTEWKTLASTTIQGTGETDAREWVRDCLVAAIEAL